jgi:Protein of unknown function (DUF2878)
MTLWMNAILYQATWLITIAGAGHNSWWPGLLALMVFVAWQLAVSTQRRADILLIVFAAAIGFVIDSAFAQAGLITYAAATPWEHLAPVWIVALWVSFALTLNHSLAYLKTHPLVASALGGIGAPLAYLAAAHWGALSFPAAQWPSLVVLAVVWALLTPALCRLAQMLCLRDPVNSFALQGGP